MLSRKSKIVTLIFSVLFLSILKYLIDHSPEVLPQSLQLIAYASLPVAGGLITLSFCSLLGALPDAENSATFHLLRGISEDPARNFSVGFLVTAYLNLIRPPLAANVLFLPYMEWVTVALAVYGMYTKTRFTSVKFYLSSEDPGWKRHVQEIRRETGRDLIRITSVMEQFVDHGVKEPLLVYLTLHLQKLGKTEEDILNTLRSLIAYQEKTRRNKLYFLAFPWTKRKLAMKNKKTRENLLNTLLEKVDRLRSE